MFFPSAAPSGTKAVPGLSKTEQQPWGTWVVTDSPSWKVRRELGCRLLAHILGFSLYSLSGWQVLSLSKNSLYLGLFPASVPVSRPHLLTTVESSAPSALTSTSR